MQQNKIIILTAPSGAGKTSITHYLLREFPELAFSISIATRKRREKEVEGKDYYFMTEEDGLLVGDQEFVRQRDSPDSLCSAVLR